MRLRTLLTTAVVGTLIAGSTGLTAQAAPVPSPVRAGAVVAWGDPANPNTVDALAIPDDLTSPVVDVATSSTVTALVTVDGGLRVLGPADNAVVSGAPEDVTDAVAVAIPGNGSGAAVLHADGTVTGWGGPGGALEGVPDGLRAKAIAVSGGGTGYAVRTDGTLAHWGADPTAEGEADPIPDGLSGLVDVSSNTFQTIALKADGTVAIWGYSAYFPALMTTPDFAGKKVTQISAGGRANGVVLDDGSIEVWGTTVPTGDPDLEDAEVVSLSVGASNVGVVTDDGVVHTWGSNEPINSNRPGDLADEPVAAIAVGETHAAVIVTTFREVTAPVVTGTPQVGKTLTVAPGTLSLTPDDPATGQWYAGNDPIAGQTGSTLALSQALVGKTIRYESSATRGDKTVVSVSNAVGPVTPSTVASTTTLAVAPATGAYGATRTATVTVAKAGGTPTGTVTFTLDGAATTAALTGGTATWALPQGLAVGTHTLTAAYQGDATTNPSASTAVSVTVGKAASKVKAAKPKLAGKGKKVVKKVTLALTVTAPAGVSPAGKVTLTLQGKTKAKVTAKVNAKGKATVTLKKVKRGSYKAKLAYAGNASVAAASATSKFKI